MKHRQGILMFFCSCIPGCGQMYQGYMNRGLSLMLLFWGLIGASFFLYFEALLVLLFPLWLYCFFDSYNLRSRILDGASPKDELLFDLFALDAQKLSTLCRKRHSLIGWCLVLVGVWMIYDRLIRRLMEELIWRFEHLQWLYSLVVYDVPRLAVSLLIIALGVWFIRGPKRDVPEEDIPVFIPPAPEEPVTAPVETVTTPKEEQEEPHGEA